MIDMIPFPQDKKSPKRLIAECIKKYGSKEIFIDAIGKNLPAVEYSAVMLWDLLTSGTAIFSDGSTIRITKVEEWTELYRFVSIHLDGSADKQDVFQGVNIFKVYQGIDTDKV